LSARTAASVICPPQIAAGKANLMPRPKKIAPVTSQAAILAFPLPPSGTGDTEDPRWQRVESLYRDIATLAPRFARDLEQQLERAFASVLHETLMKTWDTADRARMMTLAHRILHDSRERSRLEALARIAAGTPRVFDDHAPSERTAAERLEDLVIRLERELSDRRRDYARGARGLL
jgi:hypothetical protein